MPSKRELKKRRRSYLITKMVEARPTLTPAASDPMRQRYYLRYNPALPELDDGARGADRRERTNWTPVITSATKFRTPFEAMAVALRYDGAVVRYNGDNRSWSQLSDWELGEGFG